MKQAALLIALTAGLASADLAGHQSTTTTHTDRTGGPTLSTCFELQGLESWDADGDISNIILEEFLGVGTSIVGLMWENVELTTNGNSFLNEAAIGFNDEVTLRVGAADNFSGVGTYSSDGIFDLLKNNIDYVLGDDGTLSLQFFETTDDDADAVDAFYSAGKLTVFYIPIPAPGALTLLGVAGVVCVRRKRA